MVLYIIGLGLGDEKDITVKGMLAVKKCSVVYLENYTSKLNCDVSALEKLYGKKIVLADRSLVENRAYLILDEAVKKDVAFLVIGDVFGATTHADLIERAHESNVKVEIIHNASILSAVGETGLSLYNFGKVTSIPFENENITSPIKVFIDNFKLGMHTLFLFDLKPDKGKFMNVSEAIGYLLKNKIKAETMAVVCCGLGSDLKIIKYGELRNLQKIKFDAYPQCLVIPGKLHFMEQKLLELYK